MKRQFFNQLTAIAASASLAFLGGATIANSANAATLTDGNATQTQMMCHPNQGDPIGRQCQSR
ncbi:MAG TPA: hypothetical protein IGS17_14905 [Oscillatoriales cyanobacterium M59_W2019_021]|nr:MAG: hypothetical protein D6728_00350 [Cyanobacteria bacterium J055]HIK32574.1 hypothetical protein [Oscillatoriales cyanobacterium M4454_W2019_049]HIK52195.1 hypothetical protein [Oscillatoriales cyanobacterium M59_W2019_021]